MIRLPEGVADAYEQARSHPGLGNFFRAYTWATHCLVRARTDADGRRQLVATAVGVLLVALERHDAGEADGG